MDDYQHLYYGWVRMKQNPRPIPASRVQQRSCTSLDMLQYDSGRLVPRHQLHAASKDLSLLSMELLEFWGMTLSFRGTMTKPDDPCWQTKSIRAKVRIGIASSFVLVIGSILGYVGLKIKALLRIVDCGTQNGRMKRPCQGLP